MKVSLREKKISGGRKSLYLDYYPPVIRPDIARPSRREFLGLYVFERPKTDSEKQQNKETKTLAESIRAKRQIEVQAGIYGFHSRANRQKDFLAYFRDLAEVRKASQSNYENWMSAYNYLEKFTGGHCAFGDVDEKFCSDFKDFLLISPSLRSNKANLSQNTALSYFQKFKAALKQAFEDKLLADNPARRVKGIKQAETHREFLTLEELQALAKTDCNISDLKQAALFSALTGLRWSDINKLTWSDVQHSETGGYFIRFTQKKTKGAETLPISDQAYNLLGERGEPNQRVFKDLKYSAWYNLKLSQWAMKAGITKHITFHCFRHTFATLQLTLGTDIYTVSKMLGHRELKTTQVYAKIVDKLKVEAANKIKLEI
ncbi:MAG: site-specific integrase [Acidobacteria bacterium]|jgi:integrase|nr:site-specific integrase [Acidobacteriota bacterium]